MDNKIKLILGMMICLVLLPQVSSKIFYWQEIQINPLNETNVLADHLFFTYLDKSESDFISGNRLLNVYILYSIYPKTWNQNNPSYRVEYCNLTIQSLTGVQQLTQIVYSVRYTEQDEDINNAKYFFQLNEDDVFIADIYCKFESNVPEKLQMPETMQIVMPTWECKACQYYEWLKQEQSIQKAKLTGNNINTIIGYITELVSLNYEIVLALFWIFLILMLFSVISLIFISVFWLYQYLRGLAK